MFTILISVFLISALFFVVRKPVLRFLAQTQGIVVFGDKQTIELSQYEEIIEFSRVPMHVLETFQSKGDVFLKFRSPGSDDRECVIFSSARLISMDVITEDSPIGVCNNAVVYVDETLLPPKDTLFAYPMRTVMLERYLSGVLGIKFSNVGRGDIK